MKSLLVSALAVGVALGTGTGPKYFIANYTASGISTLVPYPLDMCVPNGALSGYNYVMFSCAADMNITQKLYSSSDMTCSGTPTTSTILVRSAPGKEFYANCDGVNSYLEIGQYLSSCSAWKSGLNGVATTVLANGACTYYGMKSGATLYSKTSCTGDAQTTLVYAQDGTCTTSGAIVAMNVTSLGCHFFKTQGSLNIYSAMLKCVANGVAQRCTAPLVDYKATVNFSDVTTSPDYSALYWNIFSYAGVNVTKQTMASSSATNQIKLELKFCTQWEDMKYAGWVKNLSWTTLGSSYMNNDARVCWICDSHTCANSTQCGSDDYCTMSYQCATGAHKKSASVVYVSMFALFAMIFSVLLL